MKKVSSWLKTNIIGIFLTIVSIYFVFSGTVKVGTQQLNWQSLFLFICTSLIFGVVISSLVAEGGYVAGKNDPLYQQTRQIGVEMSEQCIPYRDEAELYVNREIDKTILNDRTSLLAGCGLKYSEVFDENGVYILTKEQFKALKYRKKRVVIKCRFIRKQDFTLFGFGSGKIVGRKRAPNESDRRKRQLLSTTISRVLIAIVTGSIMFYFIGLSFASILYAIYQLLIWIGTGLVTRQSNYNFITVTCKEYDQDRIWWLKSFMALSQEDKNKLSIEVNKEIRVEEIEQLDEEKQEEQQQPELLEDKGGE